MMCYRDMTFCDFSDCKKFGVKCNRSLTATVKQDAERWMKDAPIARYLEKPECFEDKDNE